jgi:hypothetical protein
VSRIKLIHDVVGVCLLMGGREKVAALTREGYKILMAAAFVLGTGQDITEDAHIGITVDDRLRKFCC